MQTSYSLQAVFDEFAPKTKHPRVLYQARKTGKDIWGVTTLKTMAVGLHLALISQTEDFIQEELEHSEAHADIRIPEVINEGDILEAKCIVTSTDYETGHNEDWHWVLTHTLLRDDDLLLCNKEEDLPF